MSSVALGLSLTVGSVRAADVIAHPAAKLSSDQIRDIYVGEMTAAGGVTLQPLDNASAQDKFANGVLKLPIQKYQAIWTKKAFRDGLTAPAMKSSDADVVEFVKRTPGAVGYIDGPVPAGVVSILKY